MGDEPTAGGRPPVGPRFDLRLPADTLRQVDQWASEHGVTRAAAIRHMVTEFLRRHARRWS